MSTFRSSKKSLGGAAMRVDPSLKNSKEALMGPSEEN